MRILITNLFLARGTGSEAVVELLADALRQGGHEPILFAPDIGPQARRMQARGHRVADRLAQVRCAPDVIHAQHATPALMAMAAFPKTPVVFASHSSYLEVEAPWPHPQIRRVTALDERGRDRCAGRGIEPGRISLVPNAVDLDRFRRRPPLPARPRRALLIAKMPGHGDAVRAACARQRLALDEIGLAAGCFSDRLEEELQSYDIVFASGRSALEAAAAGCAVVVADGAGIAGLLTTERLDGWRARNFSVAILQQPAEARRIEEAIADYDAQDAARVTARVRTEASAAAYAARYVELYRESIADPPPDDPAAIAAATAAWMEELLPSSMPRAWREVAREIGGYDADRPSEQLRSLEARLVERIESLPSQRAGRLLRALYRRVLPLPLRARLRTQAAS